MGLEENFRKIIGVDKLWSDFGYILNVEILKIDYGLDMECRERKKPIIPPKLWSKQDWVVMSFTDTGETKTKQDYWRKSRIHQWHVKFEISNNHPNEDEKDRIVFICLEFREESELKILTGNHIHGIRISYRGQEQVITCKWI